jgi:16S rRNA (guanine527-N7)-methyltransferase
MAILELSQFHQLLKPYLQDAIVPDDLYSKLSAYLDLLVKWNARINLSAIRDPQEMVRRHFGESLFTGRHLPKDAIDLLDFGSGAGFPGLPIQLLRPELLITLSESQNKKASFLREAVRTLGVKTQIWADRVEEMPEDRLFDVVTLRAVDDMERALLAGRSRVRPGGVFAVLATGVDGPRIPGSQDGVLSLTTI